MKKLTAQRVKDAQHILIWEAAINLVDQRTTGARYWKKAVEIMKRRIPRIKSDMRSLKMMYKDRLTAKCENCGTTIKYLSNQWPEGWEQFQVSKYGKRYQKSGIGWWCPKCKNLV